MSKKKKKKNPSEKPASGRSVRGSWSVWSIIQFLKLFVFMNLFLLIREKKWISVAKLLRETRVISRATKNVWRVFDRVTPCHRMLLDLTHNTSWRYNANNVRSCENQIWKKKTWRDVTWPSACQTVSVSRSGERKHYGFDPDQSTLTSLCVVGEAGRETVNHVRSGTLRITS